MTSRVQTGQKVVPSEGYTSKFINMLPSAKQLIRNINRIALPAIIFYAATSMQSAKAGPIAWAACIAACEAAAAAATAATGGAAAGSLIACVTACAPILALPFPP